MKKPKATGMLVALTMVIGFAITGIASNAYSAELPGNDPGLFRYLFTNKTVPAAWISGPARDELTPQMLEEIAERLSKEGGQYNGASKTARGWLLDFQNGSVRSRIVRASDRKIVGVFFSRLE